MSARKTGLAATKGHQEPPQYGALIKARSFIDREGKVYVEVGYLCNSGMTTQLIQQIKLEFVGGSDLIVELEEPINGNWLNYEYVPNWEQTAKPITRLNGTNGDVGVYSEMMQKRFKTANDQFTMTNKTTFVLPCPCKERITNKVFIRDPRTNFAIYTFLLEAKSECRDLDVQVEQVFVGGVHQGGWQGGGGGFGAAHAQPGGGAHHQGHQQGFAGQPFANQPGGGAAGGDYPMNQAYMGVNPGQGVPHFNMQQQQYPHQPPPPHHYAQPPAETHFQQQQHHPHFTNPPQQQQPPQNPFQPQPANYHHHQYQQPPHQQPAVANPTTPYQPQHQPNPVPPTTNQPQQHQQAANGTTNYQQQQQTPFFASPQHHPAAARPINATPTPTRQQADPSQHHEPQRQQQEQPAVSVPIPATINHPDPAHTPATVSPPFAPAPVATASYQQQPPLTDGHKLPPSDNAAVHPKVSNSFFFNQIYNNHPINSSLLSPFLE